MSHNPYARAGWLLAFLAVASLAAAQAPVCNPCVDGPEMFEHRRNKEATERVEVSEAEPLACRGPILKSYGGLEWLVSECVFSLTVDPAPGNPATDTFQFEYVDGGYAFSGSQPHDKRARDAYKHLRKLSAADIASLVGEIRERAE